MAARGIANGFECERQKEGRELLGPLAWVMAHDADPQQRLEEHDQANRRRRQPGVSKGWSGLR
jgi:hypothetical protein